jgi:hypothetical protein
MFEDVVSQVEFPDRSSFEFRRDLVVVVVLSRIVFPTQEPESRVVVQESIDQGTGSSLRERRFLTKRERDLSVRRGQHAVGVKVRGTILLTRAKVEETSAI